MIRVLRVSWPALLIAIAALAPFLDKAFTVDDPLFLRIAEHSLVEPLAPMAFTYTWTERPERMSALLANGPIGGYLLVPTVLAGSAEWVAHLTWWALLAVAVMATASLGLRIGLPALHAGFAAALVATAPVVLEMASTNMPDLPALALATLGVERLFVWRQEKRWHQVVAGSVALGLAPLARSQVLLLWPFVGLMPFLDAAEQRDWKAFVPRQLVPIIALPLILLFAIHLTADPESAGGIVDATRRFLYWSRIGPNTLAWSLHYALATPLILYLVMRVREPRWWWIAVFAAATAWAWPQLGPYFTQRAPLAAAVGLTATTLIDMVVDAFRRRDLVRFILAGWTLISLPVAAYLQMSAKYLVPSIPAVALLVMLAARDVRGRWARPVLSVGVVLGFAVGVLIIQADARNAALGRRAAAELIAPRVARGQQVWFAGHWGFQWYAEQAGGRIISLDSPRPGPGDALVSATNSDGGDLVRMFPARRLVTSLAERRPGGRMMSGGAGFWSDAWGFLPFTWGHDLVEQFDLWELPAGEVKAATPE